MRQSQLFTKTRREAPKDEVARNAQLLIRGGFIDKLQAGVYSYLPLGLRVIKNVEQIIREEMNEIGGQEVFLPTLQPKENWEKTGRWSTFDSLYKIKDHDKREHALGPTHEEVVSPLIKKFISSHKELPFSVYQFQNKFRDELRAKSGILRGREFLMKDMYSFHKDEDSRKSFYQVATGAYKKIYSKCGIGEQTYFTLASGGSFSKYSHEFQTITDAGEDLVYICQKCKIGINDEIFEEQKVCPGCGGNNLKSEKAIEVGNIFPLGTRFSEPFGLNFKDEKGKEHPVVMGSYGIGLGRLMGAVVEVMADEKGIVWPESIAPFKYHIIEVGSEKLEVRNKGEELYKKLGDQALLDDRDVSAGEKFADADLIGIPYRVVISDKTVQEGVYEVKDRKTGETKNVKEII